MRRRDPGTAAPLEQIVGIFMAQSMSSFDLSEMDLRGLVYGAIID